MQVNLVTLKVYLFILSSSCLAYISAFVCKAIQTGIILSIVSIKNLKKISWDNPIFPIDTKDDNCFWVTLEIQVVVFRNKIIPVCIALSLCTYDLEMHCIAGSGWLSLSAFQKLYYSKQCSFYYYYIPEQQYSTAHAFLSTEID